MLVDGRVWFLEFGGGGVTGTEAKLAGPHVGSSCNSMVANGVFIFYSTLDMFDIFIIQSLKNKTT